MSTEFVTRRMTIAFLKLILVTSLCKYCQSLIWKKYGVLERCVESYGSEINFASSTSINVCATHCYNEPECLSAIYGTDKTCRINSETLEDNVNSCNNPGKYIERQNMGSSVMGACLSDSDCLTATSHCNEGTCDCNLGYSYILSNDTCVAMCDEYGTTFSKGTHHRLNGHNNMKFYNITLEQLKAECVSASFTCRSMEHKTKGVGQLSKNTALTKPENITEDNKFIYYQRNCK